MALPWWMNDDESVNANIPVFSDETGWARLDPKSESELTEQSARYTLRPIVEGADYTSRTVRLAPFVTPSLEVYTKNDRQGRIRLLSPLPILMMMLDIVNLRAPPLDPAPFSHGSRDTKFTRNEQYTVKTRQWKYKEARRDGDPLEFARALRDLVHRKRVYGDRSPEETLMMARMANELAFELAATLPSLRRVPVVDRWDAARSYLNELVGLDLGKLSRKRRRGRAEGA